MNDQPPAVSVIVPNYNHSRYLRQRLESILAQTFQDFEILLLDDASTDGSVGILREYEHHPKVGALLVNPVNTGVPFKQWNRGIAKARGQYIWIAESDDWADPTLLAKLVERLESHPSVGLAFAASEIVNEEGARLGLVNEWRNWPAKPPGEVFSGHRVLAECLIRENVIPNASAVLFRRDLFEEVGGAAENMPLCGDWMLWVELLLRADLCFVEEPLNFFRTHASTVRRKEQQTSQTIIDRCAVAHRISSQLLVPSEVREGVARSLFDAWQHSESPPAKEVPWLTHLRIYRQMRTFDPDLHGRFAGYWRYWGHLALRAKLRPLKRLWERFVN